MIPTELKALNQWVAWRREQRGGRSTKVPINPITGALASTTDPATWGAYGQAVLAAELETAGACGIGFVFTDSDPYCGADIDKCRDPDTGAIAPWAAAMRYHSSSLGKRSTWLPSSTPCARSCSVFHAQNAFAS